MAGHFQLIWGVCKICFRQKGGFERTHSTPCLWTGDKSVYNVLTRSQNNWYSVKTKDIGWKSSNTTPSPTKNTSPIFSTTCVKVSVLDAKMEGKALGGPVQHVTWPTTQFIIVTCRIPPCMLLHIQLVNSNCFSVTWYRLVARILEGGLRGRLYKQATMQD